MKKALKITAIIQIITVLISIAVLIMSKIIDKELPLKFLPIMMFFMFLVTLIGFLVSFIVDKMMD